MTYDRKTKSVNKLQIVAAISIQFFSIESRATIAADVGIQEKYLPVGYAFVIEVWSDRVAGPFTAVLLPF